MGNSQPTKQEIEQLHQNNIKIDCVQKYLDRYDLAQWGRDFKKDIKTCDIFSDDEIEKLQRGKKPDNYRNFTNLQKRIATRILDKKIEIFQRPNQMGGLFGMTKRKPHKSKRKSRKAKANYRKKSKRKSRRKAKAKKSR